MPGQLYLYTLFLQRLSEAIMLDHVYESVMRSRLDDHRDSQVEHNT